MNSIGRLLGYIFWPLRVVFDWIGRLLPGLAKLTTLSLAARVALLMFLFLTIVASTAFFLHLNQEDTVKAEKWNTLFTVIGLVIVIPICLYYAIRLLSVKADTRFPDIEQAWSHGLAELQAQNIILGQTPLFLVLGSGGNDNPGTLMEAAGIASDITASLGSSAPLHWYATPEAIFVVATDVGITNKLAASGASSFGGATHAMQFTGNRPQQPTGTIDASMPQDDPAEQPMSVPRAPQPTSGAYSTIQLDAGSSPTPRTTTTTTSNKARPLGLSSTEARHQEERLRFLSELVVAARSPICPLNGMIVLLPFSLLNTAGSSVTGSLRHDVQIIRDVMKLRFPVITLVSEMNEEPGFNELVRRVGPDLALGQRFGKGFNHLSPPTSEQILAATRHACGAFEDWAYMLFQQEQGLNKPGNASLFSLLCKVRGPFTNALVSALTNAFGYDANSPNHEGDQLLFAGCYFAATGPTADKQAFVRGAFHKLIDLQGDLAWSYTARDENERLQSYSNIALAVSLVGIAASIYLWLQG